MTMLETPYAAINTSRARTTREWGMLREDASL
jgi:hypothetical protein